MTLDPTDREAMRVCRPGNCGLRLPAAAMDHFRHLDSRGAPLAKATRRPRRCGSSFSRRHARTSNSGSTALPDYVDRARDHAARRGVQAVAQPSEFKAESQPELFQWLDQFPRVTLEGADSFLYWSREKFGLKPTISISHSVIARKATAPSSLVRNRYSRATISSPRSAWRSSSPSRARLRLRHLPESLACRYTAGVSRAARASGRRPAGARRSRSDVDWRQGQTRKTLTVSWRADACGCPESLCRSYRWCSPARPRRSAAQRTSDRGRPRPPNKKRLVSRSCRTRPSAASTSPSTASRSRRTSIRRRSKSRRCSRCEARPGRSSRAVSRSSRGRGSASTIPITSGCG